MKYTDDSKNVVFTCKTHFPKEIIKTKNNNFKKKAVKDYRLQDIAERFVKKIQEMYDNNYEIFKSVDKILIELQMKCAPRMLFTSHVLFGKLTELYVGTSTTIQFVRASAKLKVYTGPEIVCNLKGAYAKRKFLGIEHGRWFLENKFSKEQRDLWLPTLTGKLDDRFDCFLYAINSISGTPRKNTPKKKFIKYKKKK